MKKYLSLILVIALLAFPLVNQVANPINPSQIFFSPSSQFWGGTDSLGRDLLQRSLFGAGMSLLICMVSLILTYLLGLIVGSLLSYWKRASHLIIFVVDVFDSVPNFLLVALFSILIGKGFIGHFSSVTAFSVLVVSIALSAWPPIARHIRLEILQLRSKDYISAAVVAGAGPLYIARVHFLRALWPWVKISAAHSIPQFLLIESVLSFTGFGMTSDHATLGYLIFEGWKNAILYPHLFLVPSAVLCLVVWILTWSVQETKELF